MFNTGGAITNNRITPLPRPRQVHGVLALALLLSSGVACSAEWTNSAGVTASVVFTDNVGLRESNTESDLIPTIAPYWSISGRGGRANFDMTGTSELQDVGGSRQANSLSYQAHADAELIEGIFFIDADATAAQNAIDPLSASSTDGLNDTTNTTTTYSVSLSPYVIGRIKRFANFEARFTYDYVTNDEIDNGDTRSRDLDVSLTSGTEFGDVIWGITGSNRTTESQGGSSTDDSSLNVNLGYQLNRSWQVNGLVGKEWTDFTSNGDTGGINWELGAIWTPSIRTSVDVGYGRRFSGPTGHLNLSHRSRRSLFIASYSQEVTDNSEQLGTRTIYDFQNYDFVRFNGQLSAFDKITHFQVPISQASSLISIDNNAQFLNDRFSMSYTLQGKRTTFSVNGDYTKQTAGDASETTGFGLGVSATRNISGLLSASAGLSWDKIEQDDGSQSDLWDLNFGLNKKLSKKSTLSLNFSHAKRESDQVGDSYDENRVSLFLSHDLY
jgi:uncharacterized protein (PEP-CTERM system associated)